jgi:hypothetical protein
MSPFPFLVFLPSFHVTLVSVENDQRAAAMLRKLSLHVYAIGMLDNFK